MSEAEGKEAAAEAALAGACLSALYFSSIKPHCLLCHPSIQPYTALCLTQPPALATNEMPRGWQQRRLGVEPSRSPMTSPFSPPALRGVGFDAPQVPQEYSPRLVSSLIASIIELFGGNALGSSSATFQELPPMLFLPSLRPLGLSS